MSLWLGNFKSLEALRVVSRVSYSDDGDFEGCQFSIAYKVGFFDESCMEVEYVSTPSRNLNDLLKGFSYDEVVIPRFKQALGELTSEYNSVVLLYNVSYAGELSEWHTESGDLKFCAVVSYK